MTDKDGNLLWLVEYTAWGRLKKVGRFLNQDPIGLLGGDNLDAHEMLRNTFLNDSHLMTITNRQGAKGNPAMRLTKSTKTNAQTGNKIC